MRVLLVNPPLTDPTGPYPAITHLAGFLETLDVDVRLADVSLELLLRVFSPSGLRAVRDEILRRTADGVQPTGLASRFLHLFERYEDTIQTAVAALQRDEGAVLRAARSGYFPPRLTRPRERLEATALTVQRYRALLGELTPGQQVRLATTAEGSSHPFEAEDTERVRHRASMMLMDVARVIRDAGDPDFRVISYAERLGESLHTFEPLRRRLEGPPTLVDRMIDALVEDVWHDQRPDVVAVTVPFVGSLMGALRVARRCKGLSASVRTIFGGGLINTTLRSLSDARLFDYADFVTLDSGEQPLRCVLEVLQGRRAEGDLVRTFVRRNGQVARIDGGAEPDVGADQVGRPTSRGLRMSRYLAWRPGRSATDAVWYGRWNKLTLARGCYWKKCAFCDTKLDYIAGYEPSGVEVILDRMKRLIDETGESGFHFVDEAMPPALLRRLAERLIQQRLAVTWWGNIRFDTAFVPLAPLLAESGCVAVSGGLEVASDRLLALMQKGITVPQAVRVTRALASQQILVHAYLMYGFPTQTAQETIDALEVVRQMFVSKCLHSVHWHRFVLTAHSPVALAPRAYGIRLRPAPERPFSAYVLPYDEPGGADHGLFATGLKRSAQYYNAGAATERAVESWFDAAVPPTSLGPDFVAGMLRAADDPQPAAQTPPHKGWPLAPL